MDSNTKSYIINNCREQILKEAKALNRVAEQVDEEYIAACEAIFNCEGRVIVTG
ncbi:MAG: KpsF/GutQ family sugar-phosphate isomerase, partial [Epulopiscium sp.]|nr:KpsF/GutQ family sugar-phosphate isomerase [Candidatus Epulonipiscium sp.]